MCSEYRHHSRFDSEHNWEGQCDRVKRMRIFILICYNFYMSIRSGNLRWQSLWFTIANWFDNFHSDQMSRIGFKVGSASRSRCSEKLRLQWTDTYLPARFQIIEESRTWIQWENEKQESAMQHPELHHLRTPADVESSSLSSSSPVGASLSVSVMASMSPFLESMVFRSCSELPTNPPPFKL